MGTTKIQKILKSRKLTQRWLYEKVKEQSKTPIAEYHINRICKGVFKNYQLSTLIKLCSALEVTPNDIISKSDYIGLFKDAE